MTRQPTKLWDYLIVTASNDEQARAYRSQLAARAGLDILTGIAEVIVVADPQGKRVGSGGSTILCLLEVLQRELDRQGVSVAPNQLDSILAGLRILIVHAGGDSRRLPAYSPCGKIFVPVPGQSLSPLGQTLFDRILPTFGNLPAAPADRGQIVVTSGDALIYFDASAVRFDHPGMVALGCHATPEHASKHGVFVPGKNGLARLFLQKPSPRQQAQAGALNVDGLAILDMGVMSFDAATALTLLKCAQVAPGPDGRLTWSPHMEKLMLSQGMDIYREICCALGSEATAEHHLASARASGSKWSEGDLLTLHSLLKSVDLHVQVLPECSFLHFGTSAQMITSGLELLEHDGLPLPEGKLLSINTRVFGDGKLVGHDSWVEGCSVSAPLTLEGHNLVVGADVTEPLTLPRGSCLDILQGKTRDGAATFFVRVYGIADSFKDSSGSGGTWSGRRLDEWLAMLGGEAQTLWDASTAPAGRVLWDARVFPAEASPNGYRKWLWLMDSAQPSAQQMRSFLAAERYSLAEMAILADQEKFHARRIQICR